MSSSTPKPWPRGGSAEDRLRLLLHVVLPYARFGLLRNQQVVSPPLALVAAAPQLRVHCEESAPYSLGGTWWLAHTTAHCVVEGGVLTADADEIIFASNGDAACTTCEQSAAACGSSRAPHMGSRCCSWVSEDSFVQASAQAALRQRSTGRAAPAGTAEADEEGDDDAAEDAMGIGITAPTGAAEGIMARHTGTMALVPPQLSSNRRLLSYVRGVPPSFLSFCLQAAQHGWQSAARAFLNQCDTARDQPAPQRQQQRRLYVVHTQLYAICGYPESRIAHSMWWCLRRLAAANTAHALPTAALARTHGLTYRPAVQATGCPAEGTTLGAGDASTSATLLRRLRASQQLPALQAALGRSAARRRQLAGRSNAVSLPATGGWVTTAANLVVSSDITFWSGTSTVAAQGLVVRHWDPFFAATAAGSGAAAAAAAAHPSPPPPPCSLFLHGSVVLAVEHKLHRDAANARARRLRAQEKPANTSGIGGGAAVSANAEGSAAAGSRETDSREGEEDEPALDVQPLFCDMEDDAPLPPRHLATSADSGVASPCTTDSVKVGGAGHPGPSGAPDPFAIDPNTRGGGGDIDFDPCEQRFLGELVQHQAFELLHCLSVRHLRLPLGPELVTTAKVTASSAPAATTPPAAEGREAWDARWLSCLFPRVEVLDLEGPPSVSRAFSAALRGPSQAFTSPAASAAAAAVAAEGAKATGASAEVRRFRPVGVRPRGLALSLGAAAAAQTQAGPLHTVRGLWRLHRLRQVVLRAYPFEVLPCLTSNAGNAQPGSGEAALRALAELSVMGWPYVTEDGLRAAVQGGGDELDGDVPAAQEPTGTRGSVGRIDGAALCTASTSPSFTMLSLTHMDSTTFVEALESLFVPPATPPPQVPHQLRHLEALAQLTQLELSKTRVTTATLARLDLPHNAPRLRVLRLSSTDVDSVCPLYGLAHLRVLNLASTLITPAGLRLVQWMPALEELFLTQCESLCDVPAHAPASCHRAAAPPPRVQRRGDGEDGGEAAADACAVNIFSLGIAPDPDASSGLARQPFAALRVLDLSNIRRLTQRALVAMRQHWGLCERDDAVATRGPVLSVQLTQYTYINGACTTSALTAGGLRDGAACKGNVDADDADAWQQSCIVQPPPLRLPRQCPAWMPRLHTFYLMHTSITRLDCLLRLCPRLRVLDVSYTPLRDDGLSAQVRCPAMLPHLGHAARSYGGSASQRASQHGSTTQYKTSGSGSPTRSAAAGVEDAAAAPPAYIAVSFPAPLRLELLNWTGTQLTSLSPLSRPPPLDWCYTTPPAADATASPPPPSSARRTTPTPPYPLCLHPHPAIHADFDTAAQLRAQEVWLRHARDPTHHPHGQRSHPAALAEGCAVRQVDGMHWRASMAAVKSAPRGSTAGGAAAAAHRRCFASGVEAIPFECATQWTANTAPASPLASAPDSDEGAAAGAPPAAPDAADSATELPPQPSLGSRTPSSSAPPRGGGVVRYGAVALSSVRRLRLGQTEVTATGLAAGFGMPQHHVGEAPYPGEGGDAGAAGLTELSLRHATFLCPPPHSVPHRAPRPQPPPTPPAPLHPTWGPQRWTDAAALCAVLRLHRETLQVLDLSHTPVALSTFFHSSAPQPEVEGTAASVVQDSAQVAHHVEVDAGPQGQTRAVLTLPTLRAAEPWEEWITLNPEAEVAPALDALLLHPCLVLDSFVLPCSDSVFDAPPVRRGGASESVVPAAAPRPQRSAPRRTGALGLLRLTQFDVEDSPLSNSLRRLFPRLYHRVRLAAARTMQGSATQPTTSELRAGAVEQENVVDPDAGGAGSSSDSDTDASDSEAQRQQQQLRTGLRREQHTRMKVAWAALLHNLFGESCAVEY